MKETNSLFREFITKKNISGTVASVFVERSDAEGSSLSLESTGFSENGNEFVCCNNKSGLEPLVTMPRKTLIKLGKDTKAFFHMSGHFC